MTSSEFYRPRRDENTFANQPLPPPLSFAPFSLAPIIQSITAHAILPQPPNKTAIVSGLNYISRIFALLGEILVRIRVDKRSPPQGPFATARLEEVRALHTRICSALAHAPPELRLGSKGRRDGSDSKDGAPGTSPAGGINFADFGGPSFTEGAFAELKEFFDSPNANRENASNPFMVMQANLYVTQVSG